MARANGDVDLVKRPQNERLSAPVKLLSTLELPPEAWMRDNAVMAQPVPIEEATERLAEIIESVTKRRERVTITTPDGGEVVVMNAEDLEGLEETLAILSDSEEVAALARSTTEAAAGDVVPLEEVAPRPSRG